MKRDALAPAGVQQHDVRLPGAQDAEGLVTAKGRAHVPTLAGERFLHEKAIRLVVIDDKDVAFGLGRDHGASFQVPRLLMPGSPPSEFTSVMLTVML